MRSVVEAGEEWNIRHRAEGPLPRADRNFAELLQELRVVFTGVQILFGFLLTLSFSERMAQLDDFQRALFVTTLCCAAASSMLIVAPVAAHRILFQRNRKRELVRSGHRLVLVGLGMLGGTFCAGLMLVLDVAIGRGVAITAAGTLLLGTVVLWVVLPLRMRDSARADPDLADPELAGTSPEGP
ncbi:DUF6328 family protein [Pseudonocardia pini]|uniref:DUF6328 family protein n=1 Tax=Pseudonocardia pini TaxID=2758030 RepID=UPI0015F04CF9|nr:DUF6328 family protein [Pseudonocardia pini]